MFAVTLRAPLVSPLHCVPMHPSVAVAAHVRPVCRPHLACQCPGAPVTSPTCCARSCGVANTLRAPVGPARKMLSTKKKRKKYSPEPKVWQVGRGGGFGACKVQVRVRKTVNKETKPNRLYNASNMQSHWPNVEKLGITNRINYIKSRKYICK